MNPPPGSTDLPRFDSLSEVRGALLTYTELPCSTDPLTDEAVPQLWIELQKDCLLRIFCGNNLLSSPDKPDVSGVFYFVMRCPVEVPVQNQADIQRLLDVLNTLLPFGALELQPEEQGVFFRHLLLTESAALDGLLGLDLVLALQAFLPAVMDWLQAVIQQAPLPDAISQEAIRSQFQALLERLPPPERAASAQGVFAPRTTRKAYSPLQLSIAVSLLVSFAAIVLLGGFGQSLSLGFFAGGLTILAGSFVGLRLQQGADRAQKDRKQAQQKQFFWHLLEVETIKLAYQDHALERHRHQVSDKLHQLGQTSVIYPSDILRLRQQMRFLKQLQAHLLDRSHQLKLQRQELEDNRFEFLKTQLFQQPDSGLSENLHTGAAAEDLLIQNLVLTLNYLDFEVKVSPDEGQAPPLVLVYVRPDLPPIRLFWQRQWHVEGPRHSWMLSFELNLPLAEGLSLSETQALLGVFRRFLPLGSLLFNSQHNSLCLRYRFVRLRGDLSAMLVVDILEVLASFGERIQTQLQAWQQHDKDLPQLLQETEAAFQAMT